MISLSSAWVRRVVSALCAAAGLLPVTPLAGEKIIFSSPGSPAVPTPAAKSAFVPNNLSTFRAQDGSPADALVIPPPTQPVNGMSKSQEEQAAQRREWLFNNYKILNERSSQKPGQRSGQKNGQENDSTRKQDQERGEKKTQTAMEEYLETRSAKEKADAEAAAKNSDQLANPGRPGENSGDPSELSTDGGRFGTSGSSSLRQRLNGASTRGSGDLPEGATDAGEFSGSSEGRAAMSRSERLADREARAEEFRRLLASPGQQGGSASPSSGLGGSLDILGNAPSRSSSPLSMSSFESLLGKSSLAPMSGGFPGPALGGGKAGLLDEAGPKLMNNLPASGPVFSAPADSPRVQPKPAVLEIPRRKF